jgi:hypothetical protein
MAFHIKEEELKISRETIRKVSVENLGKRDFSARFVPQCLSGEHKVLRLRTFQGFTQSVDDDDSLLDSVVTGNETCSFQYDPQTKDKEWNDARQVLQHTNNFDYRNPKNKVMMVMFFDSQGIIHTEFVPPSQTVYKEHYVEVSSRLFKEFFEKVFSFRKEETGFLA